MRCSRPLAALSLGLLACVHEPVDADGDGIADSRQFVVTPRVATIEVGETVRLGFQQYSPFRRQVDYTSRDPRIATVEPDGQVMGISPGQVFIRVQYRRDPMIRDSALINVVSGALPIEVFISPDSVAVPVGDSIRLTATVTGTSNTAVRWRSLDPAVATVSDAGWVRGVFAAITEVQATSAADSTRYARAVVTVTPPGADVRWVPRIVLPLAERTEAAWLFHAAQAPRDGASRGRGLQRWRAVSPNSGGSLLLATVGGDTIVNPDSIRTGRLNVFDISDPAAPVRLDSLVSFCPGARNVFVHESPYVPGMTITGVSPRYRGLCSTSFPQPAGTGLVDWGNVPGSGVAIPNADGTLSHRYVITAFDRSQLAIEDLRSTPSRATVTLTATRSCPFSVIATATHAYVVAREGEAGTSTAGCDDHRGLFVVNLATAQLEFAVRFGTRPREVALSPDGTRAYVTDHGEHRVHVVDLAARAVARTIAVPGGPVGIAVTPDGRHLVVTGFESGRVHAVEEASGEPVADVDSRGAHPVRVVLAPDGATVAVLNLGTGSVPGSVSLYTLERR